MSGAYILDFTIDGKCSDCGACCGAVLPLYGAEVERIKQYVQKHGIKEQRRNGQVGADFTCPFRDELHKKCLIYEVRPAICKSFMCNHTQEDIAKAKLDFHRKCYVVDMRLEFYGNTECAGMFEEMRAMVEKLARYGG